MKICPDPSPQDMEPELEKHSLGQRGDHLFSQVHQEETGMKLTIGERFIWIGDEDVSNLHFILNMSEEHRDVLVMLLEERAGAVGVDLSA